jgi:hypothetical protein
MKPWRITITAVAAAAALLAGSGIASAATSHRGPVIRVTWSRHHATETVRVLRDPGHVRVLAIGVCDSTGYWVTGKTLNGKGVSEVTCPHGWWASAGYETGYGWKSVYHSERGSRTLA